MDTTSPAFDSGDHFKFNSSLSTGFDKVCYHMPKLPVSLSSPLPATFTAVPQQGSLFWWQAKLISGLKPSSRSCFQVCLKANEHFLWRAAVFHQHFNATEVPTETSCPLHLKQQPEGKRPQDTCTGLYEVAFHLQQSG